MSATDLTRPPEPVPAPLQDGAAALVALLGLHDGLRTMGAAESFPLDRPDQAWVVADGTVDLFLLERRAQTTAQRHHLTRLPAGSILFGFTMPDAVEGQVLAVPRNGSRLACVGVAALRRSAEAVPASAVLRGLELWLNGLSRAFTPAALPVDSLPASPGMALPPDGTAALSSGDRPVWLSGLPDGAKLLGGIDLPAASSAPLAGSLWIELPSTRGVAVASVAAWWAGADAPGQLAAWHDLVLRTAHAGIAAAWASEQQRIVSRIAAQRMAFSETLVDLARIVERKRAGFTRSSSHLFAACQIVAADMGLELRLPTGGIATLDASLLPVDDIGYASQVQTRPVQLTGRWWVADHGPLLGYIGPARRPCALLPHGNGYDVTDPADNTTRRITPALAATIAPDAMMFYRPLPDRRLELGDLIGFCAQGMSGDFVTIVLMVLLSGIASLVPPLATEQVISTVIPSSEMSQAVMMGLVVMIAGVATAVFQMVQAIALLRIEGRINQLLQPAVWDRLMKLPAPFFRRFSVGDLANRAQTVDSIREMITGSIVTSAISSILGLFSFGLMIFYAPALSVVLGLLTLLVGIITFLLGRQLVGIDRQRLLLGGTTQSVVFQCLGAVEKLRVSATESIGFELWTKLFRQDQELANRSASLNVWMQATTGAFPSLALAVIIGMIGIQSGQLLAYFRMPGSWAAIDALSVDRVMPTADFMAFITAYIQFSTAILGFIGVSVKLVALRPMLERIRPLLQTATEADEAGIDPGTLHGRIEFRDVTFRYTPDGPPVLRQLGMDIAPGAFIAMVGKSGGGRSTMVRLLLGFETPESGSILLDGHELARLDKRLVRQQLGVVLQDGRLISGTILDNITAGGRFTEDEAWAAARAAGFDKDIAGFADGMQTRLADGAATISGGQRQRLMIARALVRRARIMILDEAISTLDSDSQEIVTRSLEAMQATRIVITHRVSAIRNADRIYVINDGVVAEAGTYDELVAKGGDFADLVARQTQ
jgi:ATP-binding cassette subfamily C protein